MVAPIKPQKKSANGKDSWWLIPTGADLDALTVTEINTASGLNVSCFLLAEQDGVTSTTEKVKLARLLCETSTAEELGETTWTMSDIVGVFDPQAATGSDGKKMWDFLDGGFEGIAVRRQGIVSATDVAISEDDFYDAIPVNVSSPIPGKTSTGPDGIYSFTATVAVTGTPSFNKQAVAGA